jgi:hypothetical protein
VPKPKPYRYSATLPDGTIATRNSPRTYTHCIAVRYPDDKRWRSGGFAGSEELARKEAGTQQRRAAKPQRKFLEYGANGQPVYGTAPGVELEIQIIPVTREEP